MVPLSILIQRRTRFMAVSHRKHWVRSMLQPIFSLTLSDIESSAVAVFVPNCADCADTSQFCLCDLDGVLSREEQAVSFMMAWRKVHIAIDGTMEVDSCRSNGKNNNHILKLPFV